jgi:hypothetical protein
MKIKGFLISYKINKLSFAVILFLLLSLQLFAADWYIDKNASGSNNGSNWANAWQSFTSINWNSIQPGDFIYISGGTDSTVYTSGMTVGKNGTAGHPITITIGKYAPVSTGHSGRVIFDGGGGSMTAFQVRATGQGRRYITIKGFECRNLEQGVNIEDVASNIVVDSLNIYNYSGQGAIMINGASNYSIDSTTIKNCRIVSVQLAASQSDGVYAQRCQRTFFHNNYIHQRNQDPNAHTDCLQAYLTNGWIITNNFFINDSVYSPEGGGTPMILGSEGTNPVIIYNNFLYMGGIWDPNGSQNSALWTRWYDNNPMPPTWVIHNTIVVNGPRCRAFIQEYDAITINNVLAEFSTNGGMANLEENLPHAIPVDSTRNNLFWRNWSGVGFSGQFAGNGHTGSVSGWSSWTGTYGGTGVNADPLFVHKFGFEPDQGALDGELQTGSSAINAGEDAQSYINYLNETYNLTGDWALQWKDINGNPRDNTPTIGAYEYSIIPVELVAFAAYVTEENNILLKWTTATENNNSGWNVERRVKNKDNTFSVWTSLGFVDGNGTSTEKNDYTFTDKDIVSSDYQYRLQQIDFDGTKSNSSIVDVVVNLVPNYFALYQNYPNPFNPTTTIRYQLPKESNVTIKIYDILGTEVATLLNEKKDSGTYEVELNGIVLASGTYFYKIQAGDFIQTKKMLLLK